MGVDILVALIGTGTVSVVAGKLLDLLIGSGRRERALRHETLVWMTATFARQTLLLQQNLALVELGGEPLPVPDLPNVSSS